jgi:hypothetical protein
MNWKIYGSGCGLIEILYRQLPEGTEENYGKPITIACVPRNSNPTHPERDPHLLSCDTFDSLLQMIITNEV